MGGGSVDLSGKLVLVTGATRGIGRAVAIAAAAAGAELIITGRTVGALEEADDAIRAAGGRSTMVELDMKDTPAIPRLAAAIAGRWERLDGFVANAAMLPALPSDRIAVAESGLFAPADLARMADTGARCFLIGESLMRADDVAAATKAILANPVPPRH